MSPSELVTILVVMVSLLFGFHLLSICVQFGRRRRPQPLDNDFLVTRTKGSLSFLPLPIALTLYFYLSFHFVPFSLLCVLFFQPFYLRKLWSRFLESCCCCCFSVVLSLLIVLHGHSLPRWSGCASPSLTLFAVH